jgi:hypothetical protein
MALFHMSLPIGCTREGVIAGGIVMENRRSTEIAGTRISHRGPCVFL